MDIRENQETDKGANPQVIVEVSASDDGMTGYVKLVRENEDAIPATKEQILETLKNNKVIYGVRESTVEKLAGRPIYNIRIEVAKGNPPTLGMDGRIDFFVKPDSEYRPEIDVEGTVDYKNLDYFQMVEADQVLAEIIKETEGSEGTNIYGATVPTRPGRPAPSPLGKNTRFSEDGSKLLSNCDGVVRFVRDSIDVNDILRINGDVGQATGNINFAGDVSIGGDVSSGFTVKSGGNIIVQGVVENSFIEATGNVHISNGINGGGESDIKVGGNLKCKYIEYAKLEVQGNINADYIIDSDITCYGDIELSGRRELIVGGETKILGNLHAKDIGSENGRHTKIEMIGTKIVDTERIDRLKAEKDGYYARLQDIINVEKQLDKGTKDEDTINKINLIRRQMLSLKKEIENVTEKIEEVEGKWAMEYNGSIICKHKLYQGVKVWFGDEVFLFGLDDVEHARIYWAKGEIIHTTL
ncbi:MAG: DUF342 domain-containing protein [Anaerovoracaceae bacterium]|jgi:uncharacterized protein (DUF342 family)